MGRYTAWASAGVAIGRMAAAAGLLSVSLAPTHAAADTLETVRDRGFLVCGVTLGLPGFSNVDADGNWTGLDVDYCHAVAASIFGDPSKVRFEPLSSKDRFTALQSGGIDILSRVTTWTMTRDTARGLNFVGVIYYDGQGMMVRQDLGVTSALELTGASVCTVTGTTTELNITDYFRKNSITYEVVSFEKADEAVLAYERGRCDVYSTDASGLYGHRLKLASKDEHIVLPQIISKEPLGPLVRQGDDHWFNIARWVLFALINAEELGVTKENAETMKASDNPAIRRLLGTEGTYGEDIGLSDNWAAAAVMSVGNYGEMFERNVGAGSPLGITRGLNALWTEGGLMYAPPIR